ncbi:MAG: hypothetical protein ACM3JB_10185 [Acidobacteriaceae bacterium]
MSRTGFWWTAVAVVALSTVLVFNYWASYQPLSTLVYTGVVLALCGLANLVIPFRFLGIRKRSVGALVLAGGVVLALTALLWPASMIRVAQHETLLDDIMPEYQFGEQHSQLIHARPEQVMRAIRETTLGDLKSYVTLMRIRGVALRRAFHPGDSQNQRVFEAFSSAFTSLGASEHEIVMGGIGKARSPRPEVKNLAEFSGYHDEGIKIAFNLYVADAGDGWSNVRTDTRVLALDDYSRRIMGRYWRLIVPGSGLLRRQWLDGIKKRAESAS